MQRRELLRKTSAGLAASTAMTGLVGARTDGESVSVEHAPAVAASVIDRNDHLVDDLAADGVADRGDLTPRAADVSTTAVSLDGTETTMIAVERTVDDGDLTVRVLPELDFAYATLDAGDGVETYGDGVAPASCSGCYYEICYCVDECGDYCCDHKCTCVLKCHCGGPCRS